MPSERYFPTSSFGAAFFSSSSSLLYTFLIYKPIKTRICEEPYTQQPQRVSTTDTFIDRARKGPLDSLVPTDETEDDFEIFFSSLLDVGIYAVIGLALDEDQGVLRLSIIVCYD